MKEYCVFRGGRKIEQLKDTSLFFTTDQNIANAYALEHPHGVTMRAKLTFERPLTVDAKGENSGDIPIDALPKKIRKFIEGRTTSTDELKQIASELGYDGVVVTNVDDTPTADGRMATTLIAISGKDSVRSLYNLGRPRGRDDEK